MNADKGQITVEYLVLFAIVAILATISTTKFLPVIKNAATDMYSKSMSNLTQDR